MALANLYPQNLGEWKTEMEERRDRGVCWSNIEVTEEEEGEEEEEDGEKEEEEEGEEEEKELGGKGEEMWEGKERKKMMVNVDEEESDIEMEVKEDEEEEKKVPRVEESEEEGERNERNFKNEEMGEEEEEPEKQDGGNGVKREVNASDEEDEGGEVREGEEEEEDKDNRVKEGEEVEGGEVVYKNEEEEQQEHEHIQRNQEEAAQEGENLSDSVKSDHGQSNLTEFEDKKGKDANDYCSFEGAKDDEERDVDPEETSGERKEDKDEEHQDLLQWEEEESTDDDEAGCSGDEDGYDENTEQIYYQEDYPLRLFRTLTEFRDSSVLTDLCLSSEDGDSLNAHSCVMAAISGLIRESLSRREADGMKDGDESISIHKFSLYLDVDHVGLKAVVEFAYTGLISCLNRDTVGQIKAAAETLAAPRVLDLCIEEEEKPSRTGARAEADEISAEEQVTISLRSIKRLWTDRVGCDVVLEALQASIRAHRVVLAAGSDYFRGMFTLGMRESLQPCITLPFLMASELEALIGCSYSGTVPLSWSRVFEITATAIQLQYQPALSLCLDFLQQEINPHSCLDVAAFAEAYDMALLLEVAEDFVLRQFQKVACTSKFKDLSAKKIFKYLNSSSLCVSSELVVFKAVVAWIQAKPKRRLKLAKELMKTVHFPLMTFKEFREVQYLSMWSDHSLEELYEAVFEDFCSNDTAPQNQCRVYLPKDSLVLIGGDQILEDLGRRSISRELWFGNSLVNHTGIKKALEWRRLGEMPELARFRHDVAVLNGQLYVFGGKMYYGKDDTLDSVLRYDPLHNSWETLAQMQEKRCAFSVVVLDENIYAIGGLCDPDYSESVERYCLAANSWSFSQPLDLPLSGHVAKVLHGQIFISGGLNSDYQCLSSMFLYHPETGSNYLANMTRPRAHHCMETLGDYLYVAGGITTNDHMFVVDHLDCEVYSPAADCWTAIAPLPVPHVGAGSVVLEGKLYVLGGYSQDDYSDTNMIHRYDPSLYRWENMGKMPGPNNNTGACLLCLPSELRL